MAEVDVEREDGVLTIRLNRPEKRNALDTATLRTVADLLDDHAEDPSVRCVVITATGNTFCAGADVVEWAEAEAKGELESYGWTELAHRLIKHLNAYPKPTVAAISGKAVGAGIDLALACDFRVAIDSATLRCGYTGMGYCPDMGGTWLLPRVLGIESAKRFVFLNEAWNADTAVRLGLVSRAVGTDAFRDEVHDLAIRLAAGPTLAIGHSKWLIDTASERNFAQQLDLELESGVACGRSDDAGEALQAAQEKRTPIFNGR